MPLADLLRERFKVRTRAVEDPRDITAITTTAQMILGNNPNRLGFIIINTGGKFVCIGLTNGVTTTTGIRLDAYGGAVSMIWDEDFDMTAWAWWIIADTGGSTAYCLEMVEY